MTFVDHNEIIERLYESGMDEDALRPDYSGYNMNGRTCLGIVCGLSEFVAFVLNLGADYDWLPSVRTDSMGMSTIYYWPSVQVAP